MKEPYRAGLPSPRFDPSTIVSRQGAGSVLSVVPGTQPPPTSIRDLGGFVQIAPWYVYEYPSSQDWNVAALNFVAVANATTVVPATFSFTVPATYAGVIKNIQLVVQNSLNTIDLRVTLLKNTAPIQGWSGIAFPPVQATDVIVPYNGMVIRLQQGETLTAQFTEASGTNYTCSIQAQGWITPVSEIARLQNGINV